MLKSRAPDTAESRRRTGTRPSGDKRIGSRDPRSLGAAAAGAALQVAVFVLYWRLHLLDELALALATAIVVAATVLFSHVSTFLPVFGSLRKARQELGSALGLRFTYAALAGLYCLSGSLFEQVYPWVFDAFAHVIAILRPGSSFEAGLAGAVAALTSRRTVFLLTASIGLALALAGADAASSRFGERARLRSLYARHIKGAEIRQDEHLLWSVAFFSGLTVSYGISAAFLVLAALRREAASGQAEWLGGSSEPASQRDGFWILESRLVTAGLQSSAVFLPLTNLAIGLQRAFVGCLCFPVFFVILASLLPASAGTRRACSLALRVTTVLVLLLAVCLQWMAPEANPLLTRIEQNMAWVLDLGSPYLTWLVQLLTSVALVAYTSYALTSPGRAARQESDPLLGYLHYKYGILYMSLAVRVPLAIFFLWSLPLQEGEFASWAPGLTTYCMVLILCVLIKQSERAESSHVRRIADRFSRSAIDRSLKTHRRTIRKRLLLRDAANLLFVSIFTLIALGQSLPVLRIAALPMFLFVTVCYCLSLVDETVIATRHLGLQRGIPAIDRLAGWSVRRTSS